jgi:hypothetical protein
MRVFRSIRGYVWTTSGIALIASCKLLFANTPDSPQATWSRPWCYFLVALTFVVAAYLIRLVGKTSANLERLTILILLLWCFESVLRYLARSGERWATIPHEPALSAAVSCLVAVLAILRTLQVARECWARSAYLR